VHTERLTTALEGRYQIERQLGMGGMATVYLAADLKHDRKVALKVLKPELAAVLGAERFVVEIKTTAALQHPHILPLFDSGTAEGFLFYVMPYIEGETLREKLNRETQLGVEEAVRITRDVADALDYAHRHGVIHRDIKPENILLHDGRPMVADFGIALAVSAAAGGRMTETGLSLGTPHYMSPEQATAAKEITARSDVYSLGSVLYEMLAGAPPHVGATAQQIIMKIITEAAAPVTQLRKAVPPHVAAAVARSLEKLPADRFESAKAFADALADPTFAHSSVTGFGAASLDGRAAGAAPWDRRSRVLAGMVALLAVVAGWLALGRGGGTDRAPAPVVAFTLIDSVPNNVSEGAISVDGSIAYIRDTEIRIRRAGEVAEVALAGADGPARDRVTFSPDGRQLAYIVGTGAGGAQRSVLRRISTSGGTASTVWSGPTGAAAILMNWSEDGWIHFVNWRASGSTFVVSRVREVGGEAEELYTSPAAFVSDFWSPPGSGHAVLCSVPISGAPPRVMSLDLATGDTVTIRPEACSPRWSPTGHLLVTTMDGAVDAIPFDPRRMRATGPPARVLDNVSTNNAAGSYALTPAGTLWYLAGPATSTTAGSAMQLAFLDLTGRRTNIPLPPTDHPDASFSPDGRQLAYTRGDQIWVYDLDLGTHVQLTTKGSATHNPVWSPDGKRIAFRQLREEQRGGEVYVQAFGEDTAARHVPGTEYGDNPAQWLADGTLLVHTDGAARDVFAFKMEPPGGVTPLLRADWVERMAHVSPDGKWIAFLSEEAGPSRVTVRSWPDLRKKSVVSEGPTVFDPPSWSPDSRTLYYRQQQRLVAATLTGTDSLQVSARRVLADSLRIMALRGLHPDGKRFLVFVNAAQADSVAQRAPRKVIVVTNWLTAMRARLEAGPATP
jgi:Tol biopolymer transport system component